VDAEATTAAPARRREPWPLAIAGLLVAMGGVLALFLALAIAHPDPVVVADAYAASARYDAELRSAARAAELGLRLDLTSEPAADGARVTARLLDASGAALAAERVQLRRERPTQGGFDAAIEASASGDAWSAVVPLPLAGRWIVEARAERGTERVVRRIVVEAAP